MNNIICIDGLSGVGKTSVAKELGKILGFNILHSGLIYRFIAHLVLKRYGTTLPSIIEIEAFIKKALPLVKDFTNFIILGKTDLGFLSNTPEVDIMAAYIGSLEKVREELIPIQRMFLRGEGLIAEGRDMGMTIFPEASFKFFLFASLIERSKRKCFQRKLENDALGIINVLESLAIRDFNDFILFKKNNLYGSKDYFKMDTSNANMQSQVHKILGIFRRGWYV